MSSTNISIKQEAYDFLKSIKREGESFSDAILSFRRNGKLAEFHGILSKEDTQDTKVKLEQARVDANKQAHDRIRQLRNH